MVTALLSPLNFYLASQRYFSNYWEAHALQTPSARASGSYGTLHYGHYLFYRMSNVSGSLFTTVYWSPELYSFDGTFGIKYRFQLEFEDDQLFATSTAAIEPDIAKEDCGMSAGSISFDIYGGILTSEDCI